MDVLTRWTSAGLLALFGLVLLADGLHGMAHGAAHFHWASVFAGHCDHAHDPADDEWPGEMPSECEVCDWDFFVSLGVDLPVWDLPLFVETTPASDWAMAVPETPVRRARRSAPRRGPPASGSRVTSVK